ncbi:hypothetical protein pdam_00007935 [Pocillopora damicornis]|uniref:Uncharacterized protein n=1 Tax=Pocillopora damicornis TaxID=46731 RepID=A0A3M6UF03_POCDA|nr:hypothetical protein pdam_00007935 [Pocillopora damicornis]
MLFGIGLDFLSWRSPPSISMPPVLRAFQGDEVKCSMAGTPPMYTGILNESMVLVDITSTPTIKLLMAGNFSCVATSNYGSDL